jgi:hypothetical protein
MPARTEQLGLLNIATLPYAQENFQITTTRNSVRDWAKKVMPDYVKAARLNFHQHMASRESDVKVPLKFPHQFMKDAGERGLLGIVTYEMPPLEQVAAIEALAAEDAGLALKILVQNTLTAFPIKKYGTESQKEKYLGPMAKGDLIGAFALSEPNHGSDAMSLECKMEKVDGGWKITGDKIWSTSANAADIMVLAARTGKGKDDITTFIVPLDKNKKGLEINTIAKHGQHSSQFCEVKFRDYFVPDSAEPVLGEVNKGKDVLKDTLNLSRWWIAGQGTGVALHAYEEAVKYANGRDMFGGKEVDQPLMVRNLEHMKREIDIARLLVRKAAYAYEKGDPYAFVWSSLAKVIAGELAFLVSHDAELICGAMGYTMDMEPGYIATDGEVIRIYEGAREMQVDLLLKYLTEEQLQLLWPRADHPIKPIEELPTAEEVINKVESWKIKRRKNNPNLWNFIKNLVKLGK